MNGAEALTRLIGLADDAVKEDGVLIVGGGNAELEELKTASAICQAMLNTYLPIAKYRLHVEIDASQQKRTPGKQKLAAANEFTACSPSIEGLISSVTALSALETNVRITLWEQRADGADMLSGYQGKTKTQQYRAFIEGMRALDVRPTVQ